MNFSDWPAAAQQLDYQGHRIAYWRAGDVGKPNLLLIHGFPTASADWLPLWPQLSTDFHLLAVDMLGFGYSDKPRPYAYSILDQADVLQRVAQACGIQSTHLLAHDYGDTVAQELLARHLEQGPLRLESVCLLNGGLFPETHRATLTQKLLHSPIGAVVARLMNQSRFERNFSRVFGADSQPDKTELAQYWAQVSAGEGSQGIAHLLIRYIAERRQHRARWVGALERSDIPVRVICGADDPVSGAHMAQRYRDLIPQPDVVLLDGIGHYPQCEAPEAVWQAFASFQAQL